MLEKMMTEELNLQEKINAGTAWTRNEQFDKDGYLVVKDLWDPEELYYPVPNKRGQLYYNGNDDQNCTHVPEEGQVEGSLARYSHPHYKKIHSGVRKKLEKIIGRNLYDTYYYDRYYFVGQELKKHADRDACEISVSIHISTNLPDDLKNWPFKIKTPDIYKDLNEEEQFNYKMKSIIKTSGEERSCILNPGDGVIYKGCERPHWRDPMPGKKKGLFNKTEYYYHQIFFHYVLEDGQRSHCAWDMYQ